MELTDLATIRTLCEKYDFALSKGFGQNFIVNPGVPPKIVDAAGIDRSFGVLEIGPGVCSLRMPNPWTSTSFVMSSA